MMDVNQTTERPNEVLLFAMVRLLDTSKAALRNRASMKWRCLKNTGPRPGISASGRTLVVF